MSLNSLRDGDGDDDDKRGGSAQHRYKEFDCPSCNANNPVDPPFGDKDELTCNYCGTGYWVRVSDEGKVRFLEQ